jgi:signal transduction histidine kinase
MPVEAPGKTQLRVTSPNEMDVRLEVVIRTQNGFLANSSHEMKTPLSFLQGFAQATLDGTVGGEKEST